MFKIPKEQLLSFVAVTASICLIISLFYYFRLSGDYTQLTIESKQSPKPSTELSSTKDKITYNDKQQLTNKIDLLQKQVAAAKTAELTKSMPKNSTMDNKSTYIFPVEKKYVYITFDDGPSEYTPQVLEILKNNNIKATFFVVYNSNQEYYKQIVEQGHTIALHSYSHEYPEIYSSLDGYFEDLERLSNYVEAITGVKSKIVRLPGGSSNVISKKYCRGIITKITNELTARGYKYYDWNVQCEDATTPGISPSSILEKIKDYTYAGKQPKPFIILLLHNSTQTPTTVDALQSIIDYYKELGYSFEQIDETTPEIHESIQN